MLGRLLRAALVVATPIIWGWLIYTSHLPLAKLLVLHAIGIIALRLLPKFLAAVHGAWNKKWEGARIFALEAATIILIILGLAILIPKILEHLPAGAITSIARNLWSELITAIQQMF